MIFICLYTMFIYFMDNIDTLIKQKIDFYINNKIESIIDLKLNNKFNSNKNDFLSDFNNLNVISIDDNNISDDIDNNDSNFSDNDDIDIDNNNNNNNNDSNFNDNIDSNFRDNDIHDDDNDDNDNYDNDDDDNFSEDFNDNIDVNNNFYNYVLNYNNSNNSNNSNYSIKRKISSGYLICLSTINNPNYYYFDCCSNINKELLLINKYNINKVTLNFYSKILFDTNLNIKSCWTLLDSIQLDYLKKKLQSISINNKLYFGNNNINHINTNGYVYCISSNKDNDNNIYKVGGTNNLQRRIKELQTGSPDIIEVEFYIKSDNWRITEKNIHNSLKALNKIRFNNTEWFECDKKFLADIFKNFAVNNELLYYNHNKNTNFNMKFMFFNIISNYDTQLFNKLINNTDEQNHLLLKIKKTPEEFKVFFNDKKSICDYLENLVFKKNYVINDDYLNYLPKINAIVKIEKILGINRFEFDKINDSYNKDNIINSIKTELINIKDDIYNLYRNDKSKKYIEDHIISNINNLKNNQDIKVLLGKYYNKIIDNIIIRNIKKIKIKKDGKWVNDRIINFFVNHTLL